ncbi:cation channel sperm-associated protein 4-like [Leucoraja erinacea]|uniref:cation channel sperm-associated protein 4-like n=1 Tax=Leucoraja erinaceus TaxID=7782 RepID=UPI00245469EC|nr:cation channel sperm-associated protein 4-like [Leucoraja erinacea]
MYLAGLQDLKKYSVVGPKVAVKELKLDFNDIIVGKDQWSVEDKVSQHILRNLLDHILMRSFIIALLIGSCISISCQTNPVILERYFVIFVTFEQVVATIFFWEMLLKWYYGFWIFWKDGWNIADFMVTSTLFLGSTLSSSNQIFYVLRVLRALRMVRSLAAIQGLAIMVQVIVQSVYDMANVIFLLILITLVFAVFGVILFSSHVPESFGSLEKAMYSLFVCITQDGWVQIYEQFQAEDGVMMYWGALYLFIFIIGASFIFANIMVAAVTSNLEQAIMQKQEEARHTLTGGSGIISELKDEHDSSSDMDLVHVKECIKQIIIAHKQQPLKYSSLENLSISTYEEFCMVLEAIQINIVKYKIIRSEINSIVKDMRELYFNREQQKHIIHNEKKILEVSQGQLLPDIGAFRKREMLSTILSNEKSFKVSQIPRDNMYQRMQDISSTRLLRRLPDN